MIPRQPLPYFVVETFGSRLRVRYEDFGHDVARLEDILVFVIDLRQNEEVFQRNRSLTAGIDDFDLCIERDKDRRQIGGVDDKARSAPENRVISAVASQ